MGLSKSDMESMASDLRSKLEIDDFQALDPFQLDISGVHILKTDDLDSLPSKTREFLDNPENRNWSAMSVPLDANQENWGVLVNKTCDIERQRVSLLEEFWHIMQGHKLTKVIRVGEGFGRSFDEEDEHDAYYLAAATLLPEAAIRKMVSDKVPSEEFAKRFGASKELVEYRIKRLGLWNEFKGREIKLIPKT